jgi:hypothetical protein
MAHYNASVENPRLLHEVFAYLSDFSTTEEWDPGVVEATRVDGAEVGQGTWAPSRSRRPSDWPPRSRRHRRPCDAWCATAAGLAPASSSARVSICTREACSVQKHCAAQATGWTWRIT